MSLGRCQAHDAPRFVDDYSLGAEVWDFGPWLRNLRQCWGVVSSMPCHVMLRRPYPVARTFSECGQHSTNEFMWCAFFIVELCLSIHASSTLLCPGAGWGDCNCASTNLPMQALNKCCQVRSICSRSHLTAFTLSQSASAICSRSHLTAFTSSQSASQRIPQTPAVSQSIHPYNLFTIDGQALVGEQLHGRPVFAGWLKKHATTGKGLCMAFRFWTASYANASRSVHRSVQAEVVRHDTTTLDVYGLGRCPR